MGELEDKISALLSSPEGLQQVMSAVRAISGGGDSPRPEKKEAPVSDSADDPLSALSGLSNLDPNILSGVMNLLNEYSSQDDRKTALLSSLKPYLRQDRRNKIDKAVQIARLAHIAKALLSGALGGEKDV